MLDDLRTSGIAIDPSQSGGYNPRNIAGTGIPSLHASDRAYDVNWNANPVGPLPAMGEYTPYETDIAPPTRIPPQVARDVASRLGMRWGGDFRGRSPDPMHFEIAGGPPPPVVGRSMTAAAGMSPSAPMGMPPSGEDLWRGIQRMDRPPPTYDEAIARGAAGPRPPPPPTAPTEAPTEEFRRIQGAGGVPPPTAPPPQMRAETNIEASFPTPPNPDAIMAGATAAQAARPQPRGLWESIEGGLTSPLFMAGLSILGTPPGGAWGPAGAQAAAQAQRSRREQSEYERTQQRRTVMDRIWGEAFPGGQPNMQHPLLTGQTPQVAAMIAGLGPEAALPLLAKSAMERRQLELKDIGGQGVIFDPRTGATMQVPGMPSGGKPPSGYRWAGNGQLEPIPGGPGEHIAGEQAGKLAMMRTAQAHFGQARDYFLNRFNAGEAGRHVIGGAVLAPDYNQGRRTIQLAVEGALRAVSGAAAPEAEVQRLTDFFTPRAFDPIAVRKQKMDMLAEFMRNHEEIVTRGRRPAGPQPDAEGFSIRRMQ
ncbi:MAG TPA: M15 family metallopeptidase [Dongiaceae bacterium]